MPRRMDSVNIVWSDQINILKCLSLEELPQVVQVVDGHYGETDQTTLSNGDILTIHVRKKIRSYKATSSNGDKVSIPASLRAKVEVMHQEEAQIFNSVYDLVKHGVERVVWEHDTPWLNVQEGDVTQVHEVVKNEHLRMSFLSKSQGDILVPLNYRSTFKSDVERTIWLNELERYFCLPVTITFLDNPNTEITDIFGDSVSTIAELGELTLQSVQENDVFIASIQDEGILRVLKIPIDMDITFRVGTAVENDDYTYVDVCFEYNKRARLDQMDPMKFDGIRIGDHGATVERIYEFPNIVVSDDDSDYEEYPDYTEPAPPVPSRTNRPPLSPVSSSGESQSTNEVKFDPNRPLPSSPPTERKNKKTTATKDFLKKAFHSTKLTQNPSDEIHGSSYHRKAQLPEKPSFTEPSRYVEEPRGNTLPVSPTHKLKTSTISDIPQDLQSLTCEEVCNCLKMLKMEKHVHTFHDQQIDGCLLVELTQNEFLSLGVIDSLERTKLIKFIGGWRPKM